MHVMKRLPIGIDNFRTIREENYLYVDKTDLIQELVGLEGTKFAFLSRPRRFGKSLLVSTLQELFEANKPLFEGLSITERWNWEISYPVIHLAFAGGVTDAASLELVARNALQINAERLGVTLPNSGLVEIDFQNLIAQVNKRYDQKVVILVDEYDKPLLDNIASSNVEAIRAKLAGFYSVIKQQSAMLRFVLLTGVSQFSKTSIFSQLNNLNNVTLDSPYGTLCGYTQKEVESYFAPHLTDVDKSQLKRWYNGYFWRDESVYNPYDILLFFTKNKEYEPYWYDSGTPSFLITLLQRRYYHIPELLRTSKSSSQLNSFDVDRLDLEALLFQTGYLTIAKVNREFTRALYTLDFPNQEVRTSFNQLVLQHYLSNNYQHDASTLLAVLRNGDLSALHTHLTATFASLAHDSYRNNTIAHYEGYYANIMFALFMSLPVLVSQEDSTNKGRIDLSAQLETADGRTNVYIFEFKVAATKPASSLALQQIKAKNYHQKYLSPTSCVHLVGITFSAEERNIIDFQTETLTQDAS